MMKGTVLSASCAPGHLGHFPVAENQVETLATQQLLGLAAIDGLLDDDAGELTAQALLDQVADERRIIHHQYADFAHRSLP